ncbi:MAG: alanine--tRNA ligase [Desulfarculales bacterium]|jgi:alanyl-tRNA synthetase|nr:alanine--tRNA ligase [Desulfarculales bacterium]
MSSKSGQQLRQTFLNYFARHGHRIVASASLVPRDDNSLLFTNAGMVPFKKIFLGQEKRDYVRAVTCQKSFRASGKHNDLENVGYTPRHHTFFEMLGNFSFGDYFKKDAVYFAWDLLTSEFRLPAEKLWVSVHESDDEAEALWQEVAGVRRERIVRLGDADNFWSMGDTGPCGPCSEIYIDLGPEYGCSKPDCAVGCDCSRYLELWNLVFMQFNRDGRGTLTPLPRPSIDTGMGLERVAAVIQGKFSNYDSDLFTPILNRVSDLCAIAYGEAKDSDVSLRVVADHARACVFLIGDGVMPSNEGRGYVLRRILRRGARHGRKLGLGRPFLHQVSGVVIEHMKASYPGLRDARAFIEKVVLAEEERFGETLDTGLKLLEGIIGDLRARGENSLSGADAFKLYDTYGFPLDLTMAIVAEEGLKVDESGFGQAMEKQKARSRAAWKGGEADLPGAIGELRASGFKSAFVGYDRLEEESEIGLIICQGSESDSLSCGQEGEIVTGRSPFYGASGGQAGDVGQIKGPQGRGRVVDTLKPGGDLIVHKVLVEEGIFKTGQRVALKVDEKERILTGANHTATHLLHAALRQVLGAHVKQAGSLVTSSGLRFDFSHIKAMSPEEILRVEDIVNQAIWANLEINTALMSLDEAVRSGAVALFEERYGETVRVVEAPGVSRELCGGTHASRSGDIGLLKIIGESSVAAGVRRIEALTRDRAFALLREESLSLDAIALQLKTLPGQAGERVRKLREQLKEKDKELTLLKNKCGQDLNRDPDIGAALRDRGDFKAFIGEVEADDPKALRALADSLRGRLLPDKAWVMVLGAKTEGKALLLAMVSKDMTGRFQAGNIIKELAPLVGGGGGGRPDMAQAGGVNAAGLPAALEKAGEIVR